MMMEDMNLNNAKAIIILKRKDGEKEKETFKIKQVKTKEGVEYEETLIEFSNGKQITQNHTQDCCEHVYADFEAIDDLAYDYEFTEPLLFEEVEGYGFRFGNEGKMVSVPCYDVQNGYYSSVLRILYDYETVIPHCELEHQID